MPAEESYVQNPPDSTGKSIRLLQMDVVQPDGTFSTVYMQVAAIADEKGRLIYGRTNNILADIIDEVDKINFLLEAGTE